MIQIQDTGIHRDTRRQRYIYVHDTDMQITVIQDAEIQNTGQRHAGYIDT